MAILPTGQVDAALFEDHAGQVISRLRRALAAIVQSVPELRGARPIDLASEFKIDTKLAWKIAKLTDGTDVFAAAQYMPGASAFRIFLRAAKRRDVPEALLAAARAAFASFCELVETHAGTREAFAMMLAGHTQADRLRTDLEHRKLMFLGASYVWGLQARVVLRTDVLAPSVGAPTFDVATIRGFIDLRRLRPNVPWRIARGFSTDDAGDVHTACAREPLDPEYNPGWELRDLPLMPEFCSRPLPQCRRVDAPGTGIEYELVEGAVGNTGILTCITGELLRRLEPRYRTEQYVNFAQSLRVRTPCELAHFDVLIHRELFERRIEPELVVLSDLFAQMVSPQYRDCDRLPVQERIEYLGLGSDVLATPDIPQYGDLIRGTLARCGWDGSQFDVFRVRLKYPPIPANLLVTHELPAAP